MAYAPSICCGDPEWRELSARQCKPEPVFPAPLPGACAVLLPVAGRGGCSRGTHPAGSLPAGLAQPRPQYFCL